MNKIAKIISVVLSVALVIGVSTAMLVSAFAAAAPKFSLTVVSETDDTVVVGFCLDEGSITALDATITAKRSDLVAVKDGYTVSSNYTNYAIACMTSGKQSPIIATNYLTGSVSFTNVVPYDTVGTFCEYTFTKGSSAKVCADDFTAVVTSCNDGDTASVSNVVVTNKLPVVEKPTSSTTTTTKTTATTTKPTSSTTTTTKSNTTTTTTKASATTTKPAATTTKPSTTVKSEVVTTTKVPAANPTEATDATQGTASDETAATTAAASTGDTVNPKTGDRLTATAAVVSLLAISGAAVVALRKKED